MFRSLDLTAISKCVQALAYLTRHTLQYIVLKETIPFYKWFVPQGATI